MRYSPGCGGTNHAIYWGSGRPDQNLSGAVRPLREAGFEPGIAGFSPEPIAPGGLIYFVVVAQDSTTEGSYGKNSAGVERPEATSAGPCDMPQSLGDCLASY